ncbi:MAG TPA: pitrilysin family protein [Longimicrobiaceae bacterium]|nr:pitrilysin family protein [Longimicrobiaceae bacterium]
MKRFAGMFAAALLAGCGQAASVQAPPPAAPAPAAPQATAQSEFPTTPPVPGPVPAVRVPTPERRTLANGLEVLYVRRPEIPAVHSVLVTRGGRVDDPATHPGLASFTASMLDEGAGGRSALQLSDDLEQLGATLTASAGWDAVQVGMYVLRDRLPDALMIMADVVARPDFPENEVTRVRDELVTELTRARDNAGVVAGNAFSSLVYGAQHPYGRLASTTAVRRMDRRTLRDFHGTFYRPGGSTLVLVGDVDPASVHPMVERAFGRWAVGNVPPAPALATPTLGSTRIVLIDKPGAPQSEVRIGHPAVQRNNPDYFPMLVLNTLLGGSFTSRLQQNLREAHGYTYGAGSSFGWRRGAGPFTASAAVRTAVTDSSLIEFFRELNRIRAEPVTGDELQRAKNYVALGLPRNLETNPALASSLADLSIHGLDASFYDTYVERVMAVTSEDVRRVANQYVRPGQAMVVVVGDLKTIEPAVRALNLGPVEVRPVSDFVQ